MKVTPGLLVGPRQPNLEIGHGIYERNGFLYSSMRGTLHHGRNSVSVLSSSASLVTPKIGSVVIGKITKINPRFATVLILAVGNEKVSDRGDGYVGIIQQKDVRQTNIDAVKIFECFRPADIVKARVVSLG
ncbi:Exosome complex component CSL4, partial [Kappamyces sp. JEL0680]